ncbi:Transcription initiation factor IIA small chain (TFIIA 13.5 kDa subunit) [Claviceps sp. Clav32 group G5]|nr:Transcription initiation factor IIA small chain (TFIIA 13.5 kDa subunit) [Claviceps sp. LM458 group G5]KAG6033072.1 Transcription initiation factor IIA small chain (TFIIA 13.5 kDa subunit) [Claviceps sp. Clav32 group G5]KAG6047569.1 Transcription initiation factor IIA small chain (TFIIA 13.5 kDa subunit) [Claviceps sp. Clav50 group G5]
MHTPATTYANLILATTLRRCHNTLNPSRRLFSPTSPAESISDKEPIENMASGPQSFYELYRRSSIGLALTDTLDDLISDERINPQLAMKILGNFDQAITESLQKNVKSRLQFKGSLDTYRFCDEVWTFLIKNVTFKMDNGSQSVHADKVKIVSCNAKKPGEGM